MTAPPTPRPRIERWGEPFWAAAREGELVLQVCRACEETIFYPKKYCPTCGGEDLGWREAAGRGELYTFSTIVADLHPVFSADRPYTVGVVELEEGHRLLSRIVDCDPKALSCGMAVEVVFTAVEADLVVPEFRPVEGA